MGFISKTIPEINWYSSDPNLNYRNSISSWIDHGEFNLKMPQHLDIDVEKTLWQIPSGLRLSNKAIISINMFNIASWNCTKSLFNESGKLLKNGKFLML